MIERILSGGQTGADQAGWRAAAAAGIAVGGKVARGWWTEAGPRPDFAGLYGAEEFVEGRSFAANLRRRARANVADSDGTICFDATRSAASDNACDDCLKAGKAFRCVMLQIGRGHQPIAPSLIAHEPRHIAEWITEENIRILNVCGNRESKAPGIGDLVERYLAEVFRLLKAAPPPGREAK